MVDSLRHSHATWRIFLFSKPDPCASGISSPFVVTSGFLGSIEEISKFIYFLYPLKGHPHPSGSSDMPFLSVPGHRATCDSSVLALLSELCDVSFPQSLCEGLALSCEDTQAVLASQVPTCQGPAGVGWWEGCLTHMTCVHVVLAEEASLVRGVPQSPGSPDLCWVLSLLHTDLFLLPVKQGWESLIPRLPPSEGTAETSSHPFSDLTWTLVRRRNPVTFPAARGAERKVLSTWVKR